MTDRMAPKHADLIAEAEVLLADMQDKGFRPDLRDIATVRALLAALRAGAQELETERRNAGKCVDCEPWLTGRVEALEQEIREMVGRWHVAAKGGLEASNRLREQQADESAAYERGKSDVRLFCADELEAALTSAAGTAQGEG